MKVWFKKFYKISNLPINKLHFTNSIKEAVKDADLIQENTPENLISKLKDSTSLNRIARP